MLDVLIGLVKRLVEKEETSRKFAVNLADSYLRRISRFQDQMVLLGLTLNLLAAGYVLPLTEGRRPLVSGLAAALAVFLVNLLLAKLYSNEHRTTKLLFARYPELELIMVGDKSWSNFRVLAAAYKCAQAGWMAYAAVIAALSANRFAGG
jgi:hypothetical protein